MQDSIDANVRQVSEGVAPVLEVFLDGSTEVNVNRAEQCAFVSAPRLRSRGSDPRDAQRPGRGTPPPPALVSEIEELSRADVASLQRKAPRRTAPPDVKLSLFVQLAQDLDEQTRADTLAAVGRLTTRARWKQETAAVELPAKNVEELQAISGVTYVEPGQTLHAPEPIVGDERDVAAPRVGLRRITAEARRHRYGRGVLVGIVDVGGFDFAHEDFRDPSGKTLEGDLGPRGRCARRRRGAARASRR